MESVLCPLLFIIYTNDLPQNIRTAKSILFADDTTLYMSSNDIHRMFHEMNIELDVLADWFKANKLSLNAGKTNFMLLSRNRKNVENDHAGKLYMMAVLYPEQIVVNSWGFLLMKNWNGVIILNIAEKRFLVEFMH